MWFKVAINDGEAFMLVRFGEFVGYYDAIGASVEPRDGTSVSVTENDVVGPFSA